MITIPQPNTIIREASLKLRSLSKFLGKALTVFDAQSTLDQNVEYYL